LLCVGPEELISPCVSGFRKAIGVGLSESSPCPNMHTANMEIWQYLITILCCLFIFPLIGRFLDSASS
jgi:hypothetical protein